MKHLLVRSVALLGVITGGSAVAADLPAKPAYKAPVPVGVDPWNGFYAGLNGGGAFSRNPTSDSTVLPGSAFASPVFDAAQFNHGAGGGIFGAQAGWNWHAAPSWVLGLEADIQKSWQSESVCTYACLPPAPPFVGTLQSITDEQSLKWFGTARARLGWLSPGGSLFYATGGAAWGRVDQTLTLASNPPFFATGANAAASFSHTRTGWAAGGGIETPLANKWSLKAEYLYVDLGRVTNSFSNPLDPGLAPATVQITTSTSTIHDHIVRIGVNYHLGDDAGAAEMPASPLYYKAPVRAVSDGWNGFYVGLNGGGALAQNRATDTTILPGNAFPVFGADSFSHQLLGGVFGAQLGANWRVAPAWVLGVETDGQWSGQKDSVCISQCLPAGAPNSLLGTINEQELKSFGTARGRFGWVAPSGALWYATGGAAWGHVEDTMTLVATPGFLAAGAANMASFSHNRIGWTVGAGLEAPVGSKLSIKAEYLYVDLGSVTDTFISALDPSQAPATAQATSTSYTIHDHIFRVGVNYHLN
jgi:outer membrane immunogenic protein